MSESESVKPRHGLEAVQLLLGSGRLKECGPESQVVCNVDRLGAKRCRKAKVTRDSLKCVVHGFCVSASTFSERSSKSSNVSVVFSLSELVFQGPQWAAGTLTEELKERWQQVRITLRRLHATSQQWHHDYKNGRQLMDVMMTSHAFCGVLRSLILQWSSENLKILKMFWIKWENMQCFSSVALFWWFWSFEAALVQSCRSCQECGCCFAPVSSYCKFNILMYPYAIKSSCENSSHRFACAILQDIHRKLSVFLHKRQPDQQYHQLPAGSPKDFTSRWMSLDTFDVRSSSSDATGCLERLALVLLCLHPGPPPKEKKRSYDSYEYES